MMAEHSPERSWWMIERYDLHHKPSYFFWRYPGRGDWRGEWDKGERFPTREAAEEEARGEPNLFVREHSLVGRSQMIARDSKVTPEMIVAGGKASHATYSLSGSCIAAMYEAMRAKDPAIAELTDALRRIHALAANGSGTPVPRLNLIEDYAGAALAKHGGPNDCASEVQGNQEEDTE